MNRRKVLEKVLAGIQIMAASAIVAGTAFLLYRYAQYGQGADKASGRAEMDKIAGIRETGKQPDMTDEPQERPDSIISEATDLPEMIRVRILDSDFKNAVHKEVAFTSDSDFAVSKMNKLPQKQEQVTAEIKKIYCGGEQCRVISEEMSVGEALCVEAENEASVTVTSLKRADGAPEYGGRLYLLREEEGIALINELLLEEYLYAVVASEMPSDYPEEAQKAQAVCARTYAVNCIERQKNKNSTEDLNDSVDFQVYNNYRASGQSRAAVDGTAGVTLNLEEVLYYSTSCLSEHRDDLGSDEAFRTFLEEVPPEDAEYGSPWLRWETVLSQEQVLEKIEELYGLKLEQIDQISVTSRRENGQAELLSVCGDGQTVEVEGEYQIRKVLTPETAQVILMDGTIVSGMQMLPSAFFCCNLSDEGMEAEKEQTEGTDLTDICLHGGGYGHGVGMSQCGAAALAAAGKDYREILLYYYGESE